MFRVVCFGFRLKGLGVGSIEQGTKVLGFRF